MHLEGCSTTSSSSNFRRTKVAAGQWAYGAWFHHNVVLSFAEADTGKLTPRDQVVAEKREHIEERRKARKGR